MSIPKRIKPKGSEKSYILESAAPHLKGERVRYNGGIYVEEELPAEFVMFEGVAYKRTMSVEEFNKKSMMESAGKPKATPKKIRIKGTQTVLESVESQPQGETKNSDPSADEMRQYLTPLAKQYEGDDFDVESAIYWYASDYHSGQNSNLYSALSTSEFRPSRLSKGIESEGVVAEELYSALEGRFGGAKSGSAGDAQLESRRLDRELKKGPVSASPDSNWTGLQINDTRRPSSVSDSDTGRKKEYSTKNTHIDLPGTIGFDNKPHEREGSADPQESKLQEHFLKKISDLAHIAMMARDNPTSGIKLDSPEWKKSMEVANKALEDMIKLAKQYGVNW